MKRSEFDHAIRAAAGVLGESELLVIGSQAIHASLRAEVPEEAQRSVEVDVVPIDDRDGHKADLVEGSIGEASMFHESFGFFAQGVSEATAVLPDGWRDRLVRYESPGTGGVVAWCLELHDLWVSKAVGGRRSPQGRRLLPRAAPGWSRDGPATLGAAGGRSGPGRGTPGPDPSTNPPVVARVNRGAHPPFSAR